MTDNLEILNCNTILPLPPERILNAALKQEFECLLLVGKTKSGEYYVAGTDSETGTNLYLLEAAKHTILNGVFDHD